MSCFEFCILVIRICFGFRYSDFGFIRHTQYASRDTQCDTTPPRFRPLFSVLRPLSSVLCLLSAY
jgi:hypothetical protein